MTPFLYRIAQAFYQRYGSEISQLAFVFPNRRSGIFFQKYLAEVAGKPLFSPRVTTINDLMAELSPYTSIDRISLLVMLYKRYIELRQSDETFDNFVFWGDMLLGDFDDVDKYMVDARQLYTNIHDLKEIDEFYLIDRLEASLAKSYQHILDLEWDARVTIDRQTGRSSSSSCGRFSSTSTPGCATTWPHRTRLMRE